MTLKSNDAIADLVGVPRSPLGMTSGDPGLAVLIGLPDGTTATPSVPVLGGVISKSTHVVVRVARRLMDLGSEVAVVS
jgi:hypothetical protein